MTIDFNGKQIEFRLAIRELMELEDYFKEPLTSIFDPAKLGIKKIIVTVWVGLKRSAPSLSLEQVTDWLEKKVREKGIDLAIKEISDIINETLKESGIIAEGGKESSGPLGNSQ